MPTANLAQELLSLPTTADTATTQEAIVGDVLNLQPAQSFAVATVVLVRRPAGSTAAISANTLTIDVPGRFDVTISAGGFTRSIRFVAFPASTLTTKSRPGTPSSPNVSRGHLRGGANDPRCTPATITASLEATPSTLIGLLGGTSSPAWAEFGD